MAQMSKKEEMTAADEPQINYRGIKAMPFIIGNETFEKLGTTGTLSNFLVYLTTVFHMKSITATTLINIFNGTTNFATLIGAFLCDTYFGRYRTLAFASVSSFLGMLVITLTAAVSKLHPSHCTGDPSSSSTCPGTTPWQMTFLLAGLGLLVIGAGGIRPCNLAFGADQFNPVTESGKRGITSFFNWYYFTFTFAMMISLTIIVYVQSEISWAWGFGIPAFAMFLSCVLFFVGSKVYVKVKPEGSPLTGAIRVMVAAFKKRKLELPEQPELQLFNHIPACSINSRLPHTNQFRFLDKAAILTPEDQIDSSGSAATPWRLCSIQQVEEAKCLVRVAPIWASVLLYYISTTQQSTYTVFQALQSNRDLGNTGFKIPAASYGIFNMLGLTFWIPIYDRIIVPFLERLTKKIGGITVLQKMGVGMVLGIVTMVLSGIVENQRRASALTHPIGTNSRGQAISSLPGLWLVPQLTLIGISEAFTVIAQIEFNYKQLPENMRSVAGSLLFVGFAVSSYLSSFLISIVHQVTKRGDGGNWLAEDLNMARLDYFYYLVAALGVVNLVYFIVCANWYKYKGSAGADGTLEVGMENLEPEKPIVLSPYRKDKILEGETMSNVTLRANREENAAESTKKDEAETISIHDRDITNDEPKLHYRGWKVMPFIIGNETFEKLGALGTIANLMIYLTTVFNMKSITAANFINIFTGTTNFGSLIGAFLCDTYFGRYKTIAFASVTSFLGMLMVSLTAAIHKLHPPHCNDKSSTCKEATAGQMAFLVSGFALLVIGGGGIRPCNLAFGADQFDTGTQSGRRGVNSFFNWYVFTFTFAEMVALTVIVYVQSNISWAIGLGLPAMLMLTSCVLFFAGGKLYVKVKATGSPMTSVAQVIMVAIKKKGLKPVEQPGISLFNYVSPTSINSKLSYTDQFRFLDKAAIMTPKDEINPDGSPAEPWNLCSLQQVEEVKCLLRVIPIWAATNMYYVTVYQQITYSALQALQGNKRLGETKFHIPPASYLVFYMLSLALFIPVYDQILVPSFRKIKGKEGGITILQRIGISMFLSVVAMLVSGFVEGQRRNIALTRPTLGIAPRKGAISSMSAMWLLPQLIVAGIAEALGSVGQVEFYYKQFPENMRSIGGSLYYCALAWFTKQQKELQLESGCLKILTKESWITSTTCSLLWRP
ncbi:hypothetical protein Tsubulata_048789 [Turnera subulata]|uniref:Uncharacterized protein n=1 Tax=Turnera subulata TaxID=218843 RepID=A0A9Q0GFY0_9ROSI|nr:hypothetical protein Tsubulata_048789 [Turnera subulata]